MIRFGIFASSMLLCACGASTPPPTPTPSPIASTTTSTSTVASTTPSANEPLVGHVARADVEALPKWIEAKTKPETRPDEAGAKALASVPPGATVRVIFGTWCGDSRREVTRFWKSIDIAGAKLPFAIEYVGVDMGKKEPSGLVDGVGLRYVPTFIVVRAGKEVGRIIESAPNGIEKDLGALLRGEKTGVISLRTDVGG
jgi:hypothetical protein